MLNRDLLSRSRYVSRILIRPCGWGNATLHITRATTNLNKHRCGAAKTSFARLVNVPAAKPFYGCFRSAVCSQYTQLQRALRLSTESSKNSSKRGTPAADQDFQDNTAEQDRVFMQHAYSQALKAYDKGEVPVGAIIIHENRIVAEAHNMTEQTGDPTMHAEMLCVRQAAKVLGDWRHLREATLYVTLEPCVMCAGALLQARVGTIVYGAPNHLLGGDGSWVSLFNTGGAPGEKAIGNANEESARVDATREQTEVVRPTRPHPFQPKVEIRRCVMLAECEQLMKSFFRERRKRQAFKGPEGVNSGPEGGNSGPTSSPSAHQSASAQPHVVRKVDSDVSTSWKER